MARKKKQKVAMDEMQPLGHNPFAALGEAFGVTPSEAKDDEPQPAAKASAGVQKAGLMVRKEKRKAGKVMTCVYHLEGDKKALLKEMKQRFGVGGTVDDAVIALQGDAREKVADFLKDKGFKVRLGN